MRLNLGLVCISEMLREKEKLHSRTMTRKQFLKESKNISIPELSSRIFHNVEVLKKTLAMCCENGIKHYRVSSSMFPLITDKTLHLNYDDLPELDQIVSSLKEAGDYARSVGITLSCHPSQFNVLTSLSDETIKNTITELNHESQVLDWMGCKQDYSTPMCLHLSRSPKGEETDYEYLSRFMDSFYACSDGVQGRLVLENEDKGYWNCENLYSVFSSYIPLVYDNLHDACNPSSILSSQYWVSAFSETWSDHIPVFHWSEGIDGTRKHSNYFSHIPEIIKTNQNQIIWECEVKAKDFAITEILNVI